MWRLFAILLVSTVGLAGPALAQAPGTLLPAPTYTPLPPAPPPAPVPSVVSPSAPLPGVTLNSGSTVVPSGSYVTPSYRLKANTVSNNHCRKRHGHWRCRTS